MCGIDPARGAAEPGRGLFRPDAGNYLRLTAGVATVSARKRPRSMPGEMFQRSASSSKPLG